MSQHRVVNGFHQRQGRLGVDRAPQPHIAEHRLDRVAAVLENAACTQHLASMPTCAVTLLVRTLRGLAAGSGGSGAAGAGAGSGLDGASGSACAPAFAGTSTSSPRAVSITSCSMRLSWILSTSSESTRNEVFQNGWCTHAPSSLSTYMPGRS